MLTTIGYENFSFYGLAFIPALCLHQFVSAFAFPFQHLLHSLYPPIYRRAAPFN